jgi:hypothetical protein
MVDESSRGVGSFLHPSVAPRGLLKRKGMNTELQKHLDCYNSTDMVSVITVAKSSIGSSCVNCGSRIQTRATNSTYIIPRLGAELLLGIKLEESPSHLLRAVKGRPVSYIQRCGECKAIIGSSQVIIAKVESLTMEIRAVAGSNYRTDVPITVQKLLFPMRVGRKKSSMPHTISHFRRANKKPVVQALFIEMYESLDGKNIVASVCSLCGMVAITRIKKDYVCKLIGRLNKNDEGKEIKAPKKVFKKLAPDSMGMCELHISQEAAQFDPVPIKPIKKSYGSIDDNGVIHYPAHEIPADGFGMFRPDGKTIEGNTADGHYRPTITLPEAVFNPSYGSFTISHKGDENEDNTIDVFLKEFEDDH